MGARSKCDGQDSPQKALHLDQWNLTNGREFLHLIEGHWHVQSSINWFEKGWQCFEGDFRRTADGLNLTCNWSFNVPVLGMQHMTDQLSYPAVTEVDSLVLQSLSMPSWLKHILQE